MNLEKGQSHTAAPVHMGQAERPVCLVVRRRLCSILVFYSRERGPGKACNRGEHATSPCRAADAPCLATRNNPLLPKT